MTFKENLLPAVKDSGFRMEGYYVWCGSVIKENGKYYLFAARWPESKTFPAGYMTDSEIVLATTDDLDKPFKFVKVILPKREGNYWDSAMAHNPLIMKIKDEYVLFYLGTSDGTAQNRAIGYARSKSLTDGWVRSDKPLDLPPDANNPAILVKDDGYYLYFRDGKLKVSVAKADTYDGKYEVIADNICPKGMIEDMFVFEADGHYEMIAEDAGGAYTGIEKSGVRFTSDDGINWEECTPPLCYDFSVEYDDGTKCELQRRERPFLLMEEDMCYLFTTAKIGGEDRLTGGTTWNMVQKVTASAELFKGNKRK